jgi:transcriptional regulator with XRE-family HTH domain
MSFLSEEQLKHRFSSNIRHLMANKSISESELSKITSISQSAINRIKNGQVCPSLYQSYLIADALGVKIEDFILEDKDKNIDIINNYIPILNVNNFIENKQIDILGFVEKNMEWKKNTIGFKVDKTFNCNLLNNNSIVMSLIDDTLHYIDGDTILFMFKNKYMIGTIHHGFIKPIDNLLMTIDIKKSSILGKVISIETKYIKEKNTVSSILEQFNIDSISNMLYSITKSFNLNHA